MIASRKRRYEINNEIAGLISAMTALWAMVLPSIKIGKTFRSVRIPVIVGGDSGTNVGSDSG